MKRERSIIKGVEYYIRGDNLECGLTKKLLKNISRLRPVGRMGPTPQSIRMNGRHSSYVKYRRLDDGRMRNIKEAKITMRFTEDYS